MLVYISEKKRGRELITKLSFSFSSLFFLGGGGEGLEEKAS